MNSTFTQLNQRSDRLVTAIQAGTVQPISDAFRELAELSQLLEEAPVKPDVVARLTLTRANGIRTIVEVHSNASFHSFFLYFKQTGNKRSTKELIRTASRNDGGLRTSGLEAIAQKLSMYQSQSNPVVRTTLRILKKHAYRKLISARPDELGLTRSTVHLPLHSFSALSSHSFNVARSS